MAKKKNTKPKNLCKPFILHAYCTVTYEGRAKSWLPLGYYIIIRKKDGSLLIHGNQKTTPINYQKSNATLELNNNQIISKHKKETITITIAKTIHLYIPDQWTDSKLEITMTEQHLKKHIINKIENLINEPINELTEEYDTPYGPVDLVAITEKLHHIIEIKRAKAQISACTQLLRYIGHFQEENKKTKGWIMSPEISKPALKYCQKHNITWLMVKHQ